MAIKKIEDLEEGDKGLFIQGVISDIGAAREFDKGDKVLRVCDAQLKDQTGEILLTLWNEQIEAVSIGDRVNIHGAMVKTWQGNLQLTTGFYGEIKVVDDIADSKAAKDLTLRILNAIPLDGIPIEELSRNLKVELDDFDIAYNELLREGEIFEPKSGIVKRI